MLFPVSVLCSCDLRQVTILLHTEHLGFLVLSKGLTNQFAVQANATAAIGEPEQTSKAHNMAASNNRNHIHDHSINACSHNIYGCNSLPTTRSWCTMHSTSSQEVTKKTFTAYFLHKLDFCWRRFN